MKVAVIWGYDRHEQQWNSHHQFFEAALRERPNIEVQRYFWTNWQDMPTNLDFYFFIDFHTSLFQLSKTNFHPRVLYWWDCFHHSFCYPAQVIDCFDRAYFAEKQTVMALNYLGNQKVKWLPSGYYEKLYRPLEVNKLHQYCFIGQPDNVVVRHGKTRKEFFESLVKEKLHGYIGQGVWGDEVNKIYNESCVLIDRTIWTNLGTRFFEAIGSGGFLLVNRNANNGLDEIAHDGMHFVSYDDSYDDMLNKLKYYLTHPEERERIVKAGEKYFRNHHTYSHRLEIILNEN